MSANSVKSLLEEGVLVPDRQAKSLSYYFTQDVAWVDREMVKWLVELSAQNGNSNVRICLHTAPTANFHEMIILERNNHYYRPHKHVAKGESCHVIEGEVAMLVFKEDGTVSHCCVVDGQKNLICRVGINQWHTVIPLTEYAIYHEAKPGPFLRQGDSIYPDWAPDGSDISEVSRYMSFLSQIIEKEKIL